jgi:hypothetical protein
MSLQCASLWHARQTDKKRKKCRHGPPPTGHHHAGASTGSCARRRLASIPSHRILEREREGVRMPRKAVAALTPPVGAVESCVEHPPEPAPAATTITRRRQRHLWKQTVRKGRGREGRESGRLAPTDQVAWTPSSTSSGCASISPPRLCCRRGPWGLGAPRLGGWVRRAVPSGPAAPVLGRIRLHLHLHRVEPAGRDGEGWQAATAWIGGGAGGARSVWCRRGREREARGAEGEREVRG